MPPRANESPNELGSAVILLDKRTQQVLLSVHYLTISEFTTMHVPMSRFEVFAVGEILWDKFPDGRRGIGGAPFNFIYHARALGTQARLLSRVGHDDDGKALLARVAELGVSTVLIQEDPVNPTGKCDVQLGSNKSPEYQISSPCAWDFVEFTDTARNALDQADILYFGTLSQRSPIARATVQSILAAVRPETMRVLDLNLRKPDTNPRYVRNSLAYADVLKINDDELKHLSDLLELDSKPETAARQLIDRFGIGTVVVTRGADGAIALNREGERAEARGLGVMQIDTVGSGDAFTAAFVTELMVGRQLDDALDFANAAGAYVAGQAGATPPVNRAILEQFAGAAVAAPARR